MGIENKIYKILILDLIGLKFDAKGEPDASEVKAHIIAKGGVFHDAAWKENDKLEVGKLHFFYQPDLSTAAEILAITDQGQYDAVIAAATFIPNKAIFKSGGVRIGAGTGNMASASWGGGSGVGGIAPLMNTPSFNSRATAQMVFKALLNVRPDLPVAVLHARVVAGEFDTGRDLRKFPTEKLEGKVFAVAGFGNIGREVARLAAAFYMRVVVYARPHHKAQIEADGFHYAASVGEAARGADVISPHIGLGSLDAATGRYANAGLINSEVLNALNKNAVLINYDRGEIVDTTALDVALEKGQVGFAAIDADLFVDQRTNELTGPMVPYLRLAQKHPNHLQLLPHAAADTDHPSRVAGAKQAVDQIFGAIIAKRVVNLKGDLPEGYVNGGARTIYS
jgi:lactate dehydrogenase-like 2-hydroxyacid dehydrogenase